MRPNTEECNTGSARLHGWQVWSRFCIAGADLAGAKAGGTCRRGILRPSVGLMLCRRHHCPGCCEVAEAVTAACAAAEIFCMHSSRSAVVIGRAPATHQTSGAGVATSSCRIRALSCTLPTARTPTRTDPFRPADRSTYHWSFTCATCSGPDACVGR